MANQEKSTESSGFKLDVRAYPIAEPKGNTVAFASVTINDMIAINGIRVVEGANGTFAAMPQTKDDKGEYRDIAFPVTKELRQELNKAVLNEYAIQKNQPEKASVKEQIKDNAKTAPKDAPAKEAAAAAKSAKKPTPEH